MPKTAISSKLQKLIFFWVTRYHVTMSRLHVMSPCHITTSRHHVTSYQSYYATEFHHQITSVSQNSSVIDDIPVTHQWATTCSLLMMLSPCRWPCLALFRADKCQERKRNLSVAVCMPAVFLSVSVRLAVQPGSNQNLLHTALHHLFLAQFV